MTRYQLVKLVSWAGTLHTHKRLQKVVFLLQAAGCPLEADFFLDVIGPYSEDVARLSDELVRQGLLEETSTGDLVDLVFSYRLSEQGRERMEQLEHTDQGRPLAAQMAPFETLARKLLQADPKDLEVAGTMTYFHRQGRDWPQAVEKTCTYKGIAAERPQVGRAEALARAVEESAQKSAA
jgi:uncharacterized protein YwgA